MAADRGVVEDWLSEFKVSPVSSSIKMACVFPDQSSAVPWPYSILMLEHTELFIQGECCNVGLLNGASKGCWGC